MFLVAGLGNPGADYAGTRHNIGFLAIDALAARLRVRSFASKFHGEAATADSEGETLVLLRPQTFMNHSGRSVQAAMAFYKLKPERVIVIYDELDLPLGKLRIKQGGGANGHNGIRDIDAAIGPDYWRIRLGVGHPGTKEQVLGHVLGKFAREEKAFVGSWLATLADHLPLFWQHSPEKMGSAMAMTTPFHQNVTLEE